MNKAISFAFLAIFVFYGFHRCSKIHPAEYFNKHPMAGPTDTVPQVPPVEPPEVSNPFLDPDHAEIRKRLQVRNKAERLSPPVKESGPLREASAGGAPPVEAETDPVQSVAAIDEPGQSGKSEPPQASSESENPARPESSGGFSCQGKVHCSQMASCDEAEFYLRNCPGTKMDGDHDGRPCEDRCGH